MKKYDNYKDSGIEWIGDLPSNWQIKRIKHTTYVKGRIGWQGMRSDEFLESSDSYVVTGTDFMKGLVKWDTCYQVPLERYEEDPFIQLREGDLLITKDGTIGKIAVVKDIPKIATLNSGVFLTRPLFDSYVPEFMYWILYSEVFKTFYDYNKSGSTIQHLYQNVFNEFKFPLPTIKEQQAIVNYLDQKTTQIDDLSAKKKLLIQLLEEERVAVINQAVTKGLDPTVPMKDSGIEWLGEIPEHWGRARIKTLVKIKVCDGPHETPEWKEDGIPFISAEAIKGNQIDLNFKRGYISEEQHQEYCKKSKVQKGDILFCKSGSTTGKSALVEIDNEFGIWSPLAIIRVDERKISNRYMFQSIQSSLFRNQVETSWTFGTQPNIGMGALENLWIAIPPLNEQESIDEYLISELKNFDIIIAKTQQEIELLKEYKTALISEVVTGKVDVRNEKLS